MRVRLSLRAPHIAFLAQLADALVSETRCSEFDSRGRHHFQCEADGNWHTWRTQNSLFPGSTPGLRTTLIRPDCGAIGRRPRLKSDEPARDAGSTPACPTIPPIAQRTRAAGFYPAGRPFESVWAGQHRRFANLRNLAN